MIRPPTETPQAADAARRRSPSPVAGGSASFAAVMSGQEKSVESGAGTGGATAPPLFAEESRGFLLAGRAPSDFLRMQTFRKAQSDLHGTQALEDLSRAPAGNASTLDLARNMGSARRLRSVSKALDARFGSLGLGDFVHARNSAKRAAPEPEPAEKKKVAEPVHDGNVGILSARFESGRDGIAAVGYDRHGGTSYGKYQVSSRAGSLGEFLDFLDKAAPDISRRLRAAGPGNTGSSRGGMPDAWRAIAKEQPQRFEELQETFVRKSHYLPALNGITKNTGLEAANLSPAMREVIWSTAVQHGPTGAMRIFARADKMSGSPEDPSYERNLINHVYQIRVGQFGSSTSSVQAAVANRFKQEKALALNMLDGGKNSSLA